VEFERKKKKEDLGSPSPGVGLHTRTSPMMPSMTHTEMHAGFACRARENAGVPDRLRRRPWPGVFALVSSASALREA
jgi:hypothetical protein